MALAHVDVLFFDVFGTVVDWHGTVTRELRDLSRAAPSSDPSIDLSQHDWAHFATLWRQGYMRGTKELAQSGNKEKVTVDQMHLRILNELVEQVPGLADAWQHDTRERINQVWHRLDPWADTVDGLQKLKREFKIGTLTNGNLSLMVDMAKNADLAWDFILTADLLGTFKPSATMYDTSLSLHGLDPAHNAHQGAMVAAHLYDLEAAKKRGMTTVFVQGRKTEEGLPKEGKPGYVDLVVEDLEELAKIAGGLP